MVKAKSGTISLSDLLSVKRENPYKLNYGRFADVVNKKGPKSGKYRRIAKNLIEDHKSKSKK